MGKEDMQNTLVFCPFTCACRNVDLREMWPSSGKGNDTHYIHYPHLPPLPLTPHACFARTRNAPDIVLANPMPRPCPLYLTSHPQIQLRLIGAICPIVLLARPCAPSHGIETHYMYHASTATISSRGSCIVSSNVLIPRPIRVLTKSHITRATIVARKIPGPALEQQGKGIHNMSSTHCMRITLRTSLLGTHDSFIL